jgi:hypothetical protein
MKETKGEEEEGLFDTVGLIYSVWHPLRGA